MNRAQKEAAIAELRPMFEKSHFYIADCSGLDANQLYLLRDMLYKENIECKFVANAFLQILFLQTTYEPLTKVLQGNSVVFFTKENPSKPAKIIKQFKKETKAKTLFLKLLTHLTNFLLAKNTLIPSCTSNPKKNASLSCSIGFSPQWSNF